MKTLKYTFPFILILLVVGSCRDEYTEVFTANVPVYMSYDELRESVVYTSPRELENPGKLYFKDGFIFINEELQGIHIIDNNDPADPENIGFIKIPGNVDIAVKGNVLYADSYIDLVAIDISDITNPQEVKRIEDVLPYTMPPYNEDYRLSEIDPEKGVVVDWKIEKVRQEVEYYYYPVYFSGRAVMDYASGGGQNGGAVSGNGFGIGGSMARFGLYSNFLYAVDNSNLHIFDIHQADNPVDIGKQNVGWNVETMFIYDHHMFLGTQSGMWIYNLQVPSVPSYVGSFWHITSCDPVVISAGYAYITLRGGNLCGSNVNRLDVVRLSDDYKSNSLVASYAMQGPYGLGIDDETLFVCDGDAGLKVYNVADKTGIDQNRIATFPDINAYDVIPINGILFMIGEDGFYQYDYSNLQNITLLSSVRVAESTD